MLLQKRIQEDDSVTGDVADLFEEISNAKRKVWLDMADSGRRKYEKLAEREQHLLHCIDAKSQSLHCHQ